jgi:hypothetical protein
LISGLMLDVYFPNGAFLLIPLVESLRAYADDLRSRNGEAISHQFIGNLVFLAAIGISILPTLLTREVVFGGLLRFGAYTALPWNWRAPYWFSVLFSSNHGLISWTPLLGLALLGLFLPSEGRRVKAYLALGAAAFFYVIASYPYWHGMSSFGNRFFVSLTPVFVFGLAVLLEQVGNLWRSFRFAFVTQGLALGLFAIWNLAFIFQWGIHLVPARGEISWREMVHNQFRAVPLRLTHSLDAYFLHRKDLMQQIEREDIEQRKSENVQED